MKQDTQKLFQDMRHDFRLAWKELVLADLVYKAIAFAVLTPLVGLILRITLALSGMEVLADQDILRFLLGPVGWIAFVTVMSVGISVIVLEQAVLIIVVAGAAQEQRVSVRRALAHTLPLTWPILQVVGRLLVIVLAAAAPFLLAMGAVYFLLLGQYDINYYLSEKPPAFWWAAGLIAVIAAALGVVLLRLLLPALYALPLLLFEKVEPKDVMRTSRQRASGHLRPLIGWMVAWFGMTLALSSLGTLLVGLLGKIAVPLVDSTLLAALLAVGFLMVLWTWVNTGLAVLGVISFAVMLVNLYRRISGQEEPVQQLAIRGVARDSFLFRVSRLQWVLVFSLALIAALIVGAWTVLSVQTRDQASIIAHRGASAAAPENSMAAIEQAIADRADWVEIDVQESRDGVVLVIHDEDLKRLAGRNLKVWDATAEQLQRVDIGSRVAPEFSAERIPTLEQVLEACKGKIGVVIELKHYGRAQKLERRVIDLVKAHGMEDEIRIMSLKYDSIKTVRSLQPQWPIGLLSAVSVGDLSRVDADFLAVSTRMATWSLVRSAQRRSKDVYVWTVNDPLVMSSMMSRGVHGIITDKPAVARDVIQYRRQLSTVERLLLEMALLFDSPPPSPEEDA